MKDALIRALRTFLQVFIGILIVDWSSIVDVESGISVLAAAAIAAVPAVLAVLQNALEDKTSLGEKLESHGLK